MQQFKAGIYMYVELQFTCTLEVGLFIASLEMRKSEANSHATVTMSVSPLPGNPVPPRVWCSTPLSRREEQAEPAVLPGP